MQQTIWPTSQLIILDNEPPQLRMTADLPLKKFDNKYFSFSGVTCKWTAPLEESGLDQVILNVNGSTFVGNNISCFKDEGEYIFNVSSSDFLGNKSSPQEMTINIRKSRPDCGDVDNSGEINILDALVIAQYYIGFTPPFYEIVADVNNDDTITILDALIIAQYYIKSIDSIDCGYE